MACAPQDTHGYTFSAKIMHNNGVNLIFFINLVHLDLPTNGREPRHFATDCSSTGFRFSQIFDGLFASRHSFIHFLYKESIKNNESSLLSRA